MDSVISPLILYAAIALGGVGVLLAMPRRRFSLALPGYIVGSAAGGLALLALYFAGRDPDPASFAMDLGVGEVHGAAPSLYFYLFAVLGLAASLRVITHPRPVYAALYFILTILATSGLFLILSAEFMAFALIIIYAGAILITYLFVIMLATQAPSEELVEAQPVYDRLAREPVLASIVGFVLLAAVTTMMARGIPMMSVDPEAHRSDTVLAGLPKRIETALREQHALDEGVGLRPTERLARSDGDSDGNAGPFLLDPDARTAVVEVVTPAGEGGARRLVAWPEDLTLSNTEGVGWELIKAHPGAIEIAGVILLMAMLGATILARKQVQLDEDAKRAQAEASGLVPASDEATPGAGGGA
ncbi:MAG: NADH-quinone oxidoreductase subunit J [Planctomycetota bacterium]